jgi:glycosyltransferase involved in cell wall biosynthesis
MTAENNCEYSVVIPTYNPGAPLEELVDRIEVTLERMRADGFEIIIVDDGSSEAAVEPLLRKLASRDRVTVIRLSKNFGKPGAVVCGLTHCQGRWVVTIDDDLQQAPEDIAILAEQRERDVVIARYAQKRHGWLFRVTSAIKHKFDSFILGYSFPISPLKLLRRNIVLGMLRNSSDKPFIPALIQQVTTDVVAADVTHHESAYGRSRYTMMGRFRQFLNLLVGNSDLLLRWLGVLGICIMLCSLFLAAFIVLRKLSGVNVEVGWSSLMIAVLMLGGLQLGAISIIGQYLIRILSIAARKPAYHIRDTFGRTPDALKPNRPD